MKNIFGAVAIAAILIVLVSIGTASATITVKGLTQLTNMPGNEWVTSWNHDGTKIAFDSCSYGSDEACIWLMNADGSNQAAIPNTIYSSIVSPNAWNPDGTKLTFQKTMTPGSSNKDVYTITTDGTDLFQLTTDNGHEGSPAWSPDGTKIVYTVDMYWNGNYDAWMMNADGSSKQQITTEFSHADSFAWNPDGTTIAFVSAWPQPGQIWIMNSDGSGKTQLTFGTSHLNWPSWSPDGKHIAFMSENFGNNDIFMMDANGGNVVQLTSDAYYDGFPAWSPNGRYIAFTSDRAGSSDIWLMELSVNQPPIANPGGPYVNSEGFPITFDSSASHDPDVGDSIVSYEWDLDNDGIFELSGVTVSKTWPDDYSGTVTLRVTDTQGATDTKSTTVTVNNVLPVVNAGQDRSVNEGDTIIFSSSFTDPGSLDTHTISWDFGDGSVASGTLTPTHVYADNGVYIVTLTVTDNNGGLGKDTLTVTVNNVAPTITSLSASSYLEPVGTKIAGIGAFNDSGTLDTFTAYWDWKDGINTKNLPAESTSTTDEHTYNTPGVYRVNLRIVDKDLGEDSVDMDQYIVIFDPGNGFVTGAGWIISPSGACQLTEACSTLSGKANFGFVSKYQKGVATGQTEFQFLIGNLNFHSSSYDWLVVAGPKAMYKGSGNINGAGDYGFMLSAIDGQVNGGTGIDKFRIKIWNKGTGEVVYDNQMDALEDADPTTALSGGSIIIHK